MAVTTVLLGVIKIKVLIGDRFLAASITICRECTHTGMTNIQHSMIKREKALAYERRGKPCGNRCLQPEYHSLLS